jgi:alpha-L-fucosidase
MLYKATLKSLKQHTVPDWYHNAKLGIFIHWGLFSVPAFAPPERGDSSEIIVKEGWESYYKYNPYAEWYVNSMKLPENPTYQYHIDRYGKNFSYDDFIPQFNEASRKWNPIQWADLFKNIGARYVVLISKHMDGFALWPTNFPNKKKPYYTSERNIVGELFDATRSRGLRMGLYYCGVMDDAYYPSIIRTFPEFITHVPFQMEYGELVDKRYHELIDTFKPDILWNDIGYPPAGKVYEVLSYYYNHVPEGVINDRWGVYANWMIQGMKWKFLRELSNKISRQSFANGDMGSNTVMHSDYRTPEYVVLKDIQAKKFECVRGIGRSFGYNQMEDEKYHISVEKLIHLLIDIVSKNGNLLLNIGPKADGTIPEFQMNRLLGLGRWLKINGSGIFDTKPWVKAEATTTNGIPVRFTQNANALFIFLMGSVETQEKVIIEKLKLEPNSIIEILGTTETASWEQVGSNLQLILPHIKQPTEALGLKVSPNPSTNM